jgi:predicted GIY-YIG superfamily endonuclease
MASMRYGTIYVGVTADLVRRIWEHRNDLIPGFTSRYKVHDSSGTAPGWVAGSSPAMTTEGVAERP